MGDDILNKSNNILYTILGKKCNAVEEHMNMDFNVIAAMYISKMYRTVIRDRQGIG